MNYVIDHATVVLEDQVKQLSFYIKENEIRMVGESIPFLKNMRLYVDDFIMTPSFIFFSPHIPSYSYEQLKSYCSNRLISRGCGTIITTVPIQYMFEIEKKIKEKRLAFLNMPLDFILGIHIHISKLNISLLKACNQLNISILFLEFSSVKELDTVNWGWIQSTTLLQMPLLIPMFPSNIGLYRQRLLLKKWNIRLKKEKMPHLQKGLTPNKPLDVETIKALGLYEKKGLLKPGGEISYNLYLKRRLPKNINTKQYDTIQPDVSVIKGKFFNINQMPIFHPGFGEELHVKTFMK